MALRLISSLSMLLAFAACATVPPPGPRTDLATGLAHFGTVHEAPSPGRRTVVLIKDRHAIHGAITRTRGPLRQVQRENRGAIGFLVAKGFTLMGCEAPLGLLPRDGPARRHRDALAAAIREGDDLNALTLYQPIRYEVEFGRRLKVVGVEDPELYREDVAALEKIVALRSLLARADLELPDRDDRIAQERALRRRITSHVHLRGQRAAQNLLDLMDRGGIDRGILLLGGAHADGVRDALRAARVDVVTFECRGYGIARESR